MLPIKAQDQAMLAALGAEIVRQQRAEVQSMVKDMCSQLMSTSGNSAVFKQNSTSNQFPGGPSGAPGCTPIPTAFGNWCPIKCDPCLFSNLALEVELYSWPMIEAQLWDTDTKISNVVAGALPLVPGASLTISQETRRTLGYVPDCVQIATTWSAGAQPGLLTYQWQIVQRDSLTSGAVQFSNPQLGNQYECGDTCIKVPFPSYKGCSGFPIGSQASLQLVVSLAATATSNLTGIDIIVYHRKGENINGSQSSCGCKCGGGSCGL